MILPACEMNMKIENAALTEVTVADELPASMVVLAAYRTPGEHSGHDQTEAPHWDSPESHHRDPCFVRTSLAATCGRQTVAVDAKLSRTPASIYLNSVSTTLLYRINRGRAEMTMLQGRQISPRARGCAWPNW